MLKQIIHKLLLRFGISFSKVYPNDLDLYRKHYSNEDIVNKRFYNIGAGLFEHKIWTNIDHYSNWYKGNQVHIDYDLMKCSRLPLEDGTANVIYSSHTVEHITDDAAQNIFNESYRILKNGGFIRITTPDINLHYRTVLNNDYDFWNWRINVYSREKEMKRIGIKVPFNQVSIKQLFLFYFFAQTSVMHIEDHPEKVTDEEFDRLFSDNSYEEALNLIKAKCDIKIHSKYPGNHINWWNHSKLFRMLSLAGFKDIYISGYGQSNCPILRNVVYFDNTSPNISLFVEAKKHSS